MASIHRQQARPIDVNPDFAIGVDGRALAEWLPFHLAFDRDLRLLQVGSSWARVAPEVTPPAALKELFTVERPYLRLEYNNLDWSRGKLLVLELKSSNLLLRGSLLRLKDEGLLFACTPWIRNITDLARFGLTPEDLSDLDGSSELLLQIRSLEGALDLSKEFGDRIQKQSLELEQARRRAQSSQQRLLDMIESAADGIVTINTKGIIQSWNKAASRIFGYHSSQTIGQNVSMLMTEPFRNQHDGFLARYLETGERRFMGSSREMAALRRDGKVIPILLSLSESRSVEGTIYTGIIHDLSEQLESERELMLAKDKAEEATRVKSSFLATMSHEIRTPLNGVIGMSGLLLDTRLDAAQAEFANTIRHSAEHLLELINDILDFSRFESGGLELESTDFEFRNVVDGVAELLGPAALAKDVEFVCLVQPDVPRSVTGDPGRLRQIVTNLAGNAVKFTDSGEVFLHARRVGGEDETPLIRVEVNDTGPGIPEQQLARLFQPFTQADASTTRRYGGSGLGLSISRQLVEAMGGRIGVSSTAGVGSTFWFELPMRTTQTSERDIRALPGGARVLVIDDNAHCAAALATSVGAWGGSCVSVTSVEEAVAALHGAARAGAPFRFAFLDMEIDGPDPQESVAILRNAAGAAALAILLLNSKGAAGFARGRTIASDGIISKPVLERSLARALRKACGEDAANLVPDEAADTPPAPSKGRRILIADDNPVNKRVAMLMLQKMGYRADGVSNGLETLEAVTRAPYDLILMDCQMPEMDGFQAADGIRRMGGKIAAIPIIAMTANALAGDRERCLAAGMNDYLSKPVRQDVLASMLHHWLEVVPLAEPVAQHPAFADNADEEAPTVDLAVLADLTTLAEDDPIGLLSEILETYLTDAHRLFEAMQAALDDKDLRGLQQAAHGLKSASGYVGAAQLAALCERAEQACRDAAIPRLAGILFQAGSEFERVQLEFQRYLAASAAAD